MTSRWLTRAALLISIVATACAPTQTAAPAPGGQQPQQQPIAESMTIGYPVVLPSLDPHPVVAQTGAFAFDGIYDQLVRYNRQGELQPWLATAWRAVDARTWEFTIRTGVKFHNGEDFNAEVAKWNIDRMRDPATRATEGPTLATIEQTTAVNATTLRITTRNADPLLPRRVNLVRMIPPQHFQRVGPGEFSTTQAIGTGPYRVRQFVPNDRVVLEAFDSWRGRPKTPNMTLRFTPDRATITAGLRTGDLDAGFDLMADQIVQLRSAGFQVTSGVFPGAWYFEFNTIGGHPALRDRRVRQALNYAIDRNAITQTLLRGLGTPAAQLVSPAATGHDPQIQPYPFDLARARALMAEAGYSNGFPMRIFITAGARPMVEATAGFWRDLNVALEFQVVDFAVFVERTNAGPIEDGFTSRSTDGDTRDVDAGYQFIETVAGRPEPRITWRNARFAELYTQQRQETDPQRRAQLHREMVRLVYDEAPLAIVYYPALAWTSGPNVRDLFAFPDTSIDIAAISRVR